MFYAPLLSRALLAISGEDMITFLQGLISNDARKLEKGEAIYATLLTPQGKFLHDFFMVPVNGKILIDCEKARMEDLRKRLAMYKLRSKVAIEVLPETMGICALWGAEAKPEISGATVFRDTRLAALGWRAVGDNMAVETAEKREEGDYHHHRITLGIPLGGLDLVPEKSFLLEWGIDQLNGVDYQKGCYVGQEVTARTHYRGHVKKAPYIIHPESGKLPAGLTDIQCGEADAGVMYSNAGDVGLALLRIEEVEKSVSSGMPLRIGDVQVTATPPSWLRLPEAIAS